MNNLFYTPDQQPHDQSDPSAPSYSQNQPIDSARLLGPQQYSEGVSFWHTEELASMPVGADPSFLGDRNNHGTAKHRRTRSGCYTCRARRVKCDEKKPICDRCLKGGRECIFPEKPPSSKSSRSKATTSVESGSSSDGDEELKALETIVDDEDEGKVEKSARSSPTASLKRKDTSTQPEKSIPSLVKMNPTRLLSETSSSSKEKSKSPSTEASSIVSLSQPISSHGKPNSLFSNEVANFTAGKSWAHLPQDMQIYLDFHQEGITYHHYFLKSDLNDFIHKELLDHAVKYEPLLYSLVGFSAFHHTLRQGDGDVQTCLSYYTTSVSKLRRSLQKGQPHHESILLTILQLATFEEYLGDWVNLTGHQRAAHHLLLELYTPKSIMKSDFRRQIFTWYSRFDIVVGLLGGNETILGREWYVAGETFHKQQADANPDDLETQLLSLVAASRTIGMDMAMLFAKIHQHQMTMEQFVSQNKDLEESIQNVGIALERLSRPEYAVFTFPGKGNLDLNDIVNPYKPGGLYGRPYFTLNFSWIDWNALYLMHQYQTALTLEQPIPMETENLALEQCRILEAIEKWPDSPPGSLLATHASLGLASIFLPKDARHTMWLRRKLAMMEQMGYVYPPTFRSKMAELWQLPETTHWWLPNDEGYLPIISSIRSFIEERTATAKLGDHLSEDLHNMKSIFGKLNIDDNTSGSQKSSPASVGSASDRQSQSPNVFVVGPLLQTSSSKSTSHGRDDGRSYLAAQSPGRDDDRSAEYGNNQGSTTDQSQTSADSGGGRPMSGIWETRPAWQQE